MTIEKAGVRYSLASVRTTRETKPATGAHRSAEPVAELVPTEEYLSSYGSRAESMPEVIPTSGTPVDVLTIKQGTVTQQIGGEPRYDGQLFV